MTTCEEQKPCLAARFERGSARLLTLVILSVAVCSCTAGEVMAQGTTGFGLVIGEPTGLAWKYRISHENALDGAIGISPYDRLRAHVDYLWQTNPFHEGNLALHYGVGAALGFGETGYVRDGRYWVRQGDPGFGVRVPVGLTYNIPRSPVDLFIEIAPVMIILPEGGFGLDIALGVRVYP